MKEKDEVPYLPLYHGMRTKRTAEQIKKEGFCAYGSPIDEAREILLAIRYFGKEKILSLSGSGLRTKVKDMMREARREDRLNVWASTDKESTCDWWASANPEHITLALSFAGIEPEKIDKYIKERFGDKCVSVKLKITSRGRNPNFNTGINCIHPNLIENVEYCSICKFTSKLYEKQK